MFKRVMRWQWWEYAQGIQESGYPFQHLRQRQLIWLQVQFTNRILFYNSFTLEPCIEYILYRSASLLFWAAAQEPGPNKSHMF